MKFVGLDLAWGEVAWTGTAVLDEAGRLLDMGRERSDEDILASLAPHLDGPVLVSIDAPLIVRNLTGRRPCESQVSTMFGRFHAGAHSSNLSMPSFRDGPRGGRVAALMDLPVDPDFEPRTAVRKAIEVYPHAATVTLFGLDRVVPYKAKQGRSPDDRRSAMNALLDHIESLSDATPPLDVSDCASWAAARAGVADARTHAELNRWEDAVDAVLCAYIGLHRWWHGDAASAVLGDVRTGYIIVPVDDRLRRGTDGGQQARLTGAEVESLAIDLLTRTANARGSSVVDTRYLPDASGDLVIDRTAVEVKASARSVRGEELWMEPRQAEALRSGDLSLVLVENVQADGSCTIRWADAEVLGRLLPRLREHRYFTLPVPVAVYDALPSDDVDPA